VRAVNLIPSEQRRGAGGLAGRSGGIVYVVPGGLTGLVVLGVVYASAVHGVAANQSELASLTAQVNAVTAEAQALQPYVDFATVSNEKVLEVVSIAQQRFNWPTALAQLSMALPNDVTLTSLSASSGPASASTAAVAAPASGSTGAVAAPATGQPATSTAPAGTVPFALVGCANSQGEIPALLTDLTSVPAVTNVTLASSIENKGFRVLPNNLSGGGSSSADEAITGQCPKVTWSITLDYAASYTVPTVKLPVSSSPAQTVSTSGGHSRLKTAARSGGSK